MKEIEISYKPLPTMKLFHESNSDIRCIVGPVGSGKSTAAVWEICYFIPQYLLKCYHINETNWFIIRNTYPELKSSTIPVFFEWFPPEYFGTYNKQDKFYEMKMDFNGKKAKINLQFISCDSPNHMKKLKGAELTGYMVDESIEVPEDIKRMLKTRIGRFPRRKMWINREVRRFGIEITNAPDISHPTYSMFDWKGNFPGPHPDGKPLKNHEGFWQPPYENLENLRDGYYDDLRNDYRDNPDWIDLYIMNRPGSIVRGKLVYNNFRKELHVAKKSLVWAGGPLFCGWDNSGNCPACIITQIVGGDKVQILKEFHSEKMGIIDFANYVKVQRNALFPNASFIDWADPAGFAKYSAADGGLTSNAKLMKDECGIKVLPSEQSWLARQQSVEKQLRKIDGMLIDPSCTRLIDGFISGYCYPEIESGVYRQKPLKNKYSHIHDALQYVIVKLFGSRAKNSMTDYRASLKNDRTSWMGV